MMGADAVRCMRRDSGTEGGEHIYWRIFIVENFGGVLGYQAVLAEIEFRDAVGGSSVSTGGLVLASSDAGLYAEKELAFDGNAGTSWFCQRYTALPQWIGYEHLSGFSLAQVSIRISGNAQYINSAPKSFRIDYSDDGISWTTAGTFDNEGAWVAGEQRLYTI